MFEDLFDNILKDNEIDKERSGFEDEYWDTCVGDSTWTIFDTPIKDQIWSTFTK